MQRGRQDRWNDFQVLAKTAGTTSMFFASCTIDRPHKKNVNLFLAAKMKKVRDLQPESL